uniref:Uncharacterized protein n=1 Tax=Megaselia scalaris TaxID=36166 RepID=T1GD55_MEGSC
MEEEMHKERNTSIICPIHKIVTSLHPRKLVAISSSKIFLLVSAHSSSCNLIVLIKILIPDVESQNDCHEASFCFLIITIIRTSLENLYLETLAFQPYITLMKSHGNKKIREKWENTEAVATLHNPLLYFKIIVGL